MKTVHIIDGNSQYSKLFLDLGFTLCETVQEADLLCFTGGADVSPEFYGDKKHHYTGSDIRRDENEREIFRQAFIANKPMVGICRGGQFLNVMSGGRMYQHVEKHAGYPHYIVDKVTGETIYVSSTHHQMMMPSVNATVVATSNLRGYREWYEGQVFHKEIAEEDYEVLYYEETKCLCFQPHPEFTSVEYGGMKKYFESLLGRYLNI